MELTNIYELLDNNTTGGKLYINSNYCKNQNDILIMLLSNPSVAKMVDKFQVTDKKITYPDNVVIDLSETLGVIEPIIYNRTTLSNSYDIIIRLITEFNLSFAAAVAILLDITFSKLNKSCNLSLLH